MASDYALIRTDNEREYGAGIGRWGPDLLTNRYDDRTHFIFELPSERGGRSRSPQGLARMAGSELQPLRDRAPCHSLRQAI